MSLSTNSAMPQQYLKPYPPGATSYMNAGIVTQNNQAELQNALTTGGFKQKHRIIKGGAVATNASPVVLVPSVPSGTVNPDATGENYKLISILAQQQAGDAIYDTAQTSVDTASLQQQQQQQYKGGRRRRKSRKGRKSRKSRKSRKGRKGRKGRKSRKLKRH